MRSRALTILNLTLFMAIAIAYQSCDSTLTIDKPKSFYKYIGNDHDQRGVDLTTDTDGNIYVLGSSASTSDGQQVYVVMTNSEGILQWEQTFGDPGDETPKDIELMKNGNLVIVADRIDATTGEQDFVIYILSNTDGSVIASRVEGSPNFKDFVSTITETVDFDTQTSNGFITAAYKDSLGFKVGSVVRYDASLAKFPNFLWHSPMDQLIPLAPEDDVPKGYDVVPVKVIQFANDRFYTFGYTNSIIDGRDLTADYNFFCTVGSALNDNLTLFLPAGPDPNSNELLTEVKPVPPQYGAGFVLTGYTSDASGSQQNLYVVRVMQDLTGAKLSDPSSYLQGDPKTVTSGLSSVSSTSASVYPSTKSGFLILGEENTEGNTNIFLTKVNNSFEVAWAEPHTSQIFGGIGNDAAGAVTETSDGHILVCGTMILGEVNGQSKIVLMKLSPEGMFSE